MDPYIILGIDNNASDDTIKKSYLRLAKQYHPDKYKDDNGDRFKQINEAYNLIISDRYSNDKKTSTRFFYDSYVKEILKQFIKPHIATIYVSLMDKYNNYTKKIRINNKKTYYVDTGPAIFESFDFEERLIIKIKVKKEDNFPNYMVENNYLYYLYDISKNDIDKINSISFKHLDNSTVHIPFDKSQSFYVVPDKGFVNSTGCRDDLYVTVIVN